MRKLTICIDENKGADQLRGFLFFLNPKFQASSLLLRLYMPVHVGPGRKPKLLVLSRTGSNIMHTCYPDTINATKNNQW